MAPTRLFVNADRPAADHIRRAADIILAGGLVAYPTDTLYGLGADPRSERAVAALYRVKSRAPDVAIPIVASDEEQVAHVGRLSPLALRLARQFWPGPLTLVIPAHPSLAPGIHGGRGTVAVRVPANEIARQLARAAGCPLTATSANRSGRPAATTADEVVTELGSDVDLVLDGGPAPGRAASTIVDACGDRPRLLRAGAVPWERVLESLE